MQGRLIHPANTADFSFVHKGDATNQHVVFQRMNIQFFEPFEQNIAAVQTTQHAAFTLQLDKRGNNENARVNIWLISQSDDKFLQPDG